MPINGLALGSVAVGTVFVYSAIKGKSVLAIAQAVITGQNPKNVSQTSPITEPVGTGATGSPGQNIGAQARGAQTLNASEIGQMWVNNGGDPSKISVAVCIAMHESGGNTAAENPTPCATGSHAQGLYQICMPLNAAHVPGGNAFDANANTKAAISMSNNGQDWSAWSTAGSCGV